MNLREAINEFESQCDEASKEFTQPECVSVVLAAARAFACEACGGRGVVVVHVDKHEEEYTCPECREDREKARSQ